MFKLFLSAIFISAVFAQIPAKGLTCNVYYTGFSGESDISALDNVTNICEINALCVTVNGTIHGKTFGASDCTNTAALILTSYLQGQQNYNGKIVFDCSGIYPITNYTDSTITYSYQCSNGYTPPTTKIPTTTTTGDASTLSCILSTIILSIVYISFN